MAYQPYPYGGYQPAPGYYPGPVPDQLTQLRMQQQNQQMMQGPQASQQTQLMQSTMIPANPTTGCIQNNGIIWVSGKSEADGYLIAPNSAVALWDQNNPVVYLRKADSTGKPSTVIYDLVERTENQPVQQQTPKIQLPDLSNFITRDELESILAERLKRPAKVVKAREDTENA